MKLNFGITDQFNSTLAALLNPITSSQNSLLDAIDGDALAQGLSFDLKLEDYSFDVIRDAANDYSVSIPDLPLTLASGEGVPIDFAANVGFLAGAVNGGQFDLDLGVILETASLFGDRISLDDLRDLSLDDALRGLRSQEIGRGLDVRLPFDFDLSGFDTNGFLPIFTLKDSSEM